MANGDAAASAGMAVMIGTEDRRLGYDEINLTRDYIAQRTYDVLPVTKGGIGASTPAGGRAALGAASAADLATKAPLGHTHNELRSGSNRLGWGNNEWNTSNGLYANSYVGTGGSLFTYGSTPAGSGAQVAYIDASGRVGRGASSLRYKENVTDAGDLGDIWPTLHEYQMIGETERKIGYIAEELVDTAAERFVVYQTEITIDFDEFGNVIRTVELSHDEDGNLVPDSIDFIGMLMAQTAQLNARVALLEQRLAALEAS